MAEGWQWLAEDLNHLRSAGLLRHRRRVVSLPGGWCEIENRRLRNFASNDYLNLAHDPRLVEAAQKAMAQTGIGATASALVTGRSSYHEQLENRLARFEGQESAVLFPTGYAANVGTISALADERDVIFCDRLNHASLLDGCRLSGAKFQVYRHQHLDKLNAAFQRAAGYRHRWIITDSLFSMDGDPAPLPELCDIAEHYDAKLIVDEAHATGVFGEQGRGIAEWQGVEDRVAVRIGTLSKAIGTMGGFVAGPSELTDFLWNNARTQMFSTALPPAMCAAACRAVELIDFINDLAERGLLEESVDCHGVELIDEMLHRRQWIFAIAHLLRHELARLGLKIPVNCVGPIVPVIIGDAQETLRIAHELEEAGFLVAAIRPPTVPRGTSRLRITLTAAHTEDDLKSLLTQLEKSTKSLRSRKLPARKENPHD